MMDKARQDRARERVLGMVRDRPGIEARQVPLASRHYLRDLEGRGLIRYDVATLGWWPVPQPEGSTGGPTTDTMHPEGL